MTGRLQRAFFAIGLLVSVLFLFAPISVQAQSVEDCLCVCSTPEGAINGIVSDVSVGKDECTKDCEARGGQYLRCALDTNKSAENDAKCWQEAECLDRMVEVNGQSKQSIWQEDQPRDCAPGYHYCYNPPIPVNLNVAVATLSNPREASNLAEYITAMYDLLLPASALIAVVMIMIGGIQWALAAGNQTAIGKAKDRIAKAVMGLVLVLGAFTIVYTIDPRLTSFDALRLPILKGALFLDDSTTCETLLNLGIKIDPGRGATDSQVRSSGLGATGCGATCTIAEIPDGTVFAGEIEVGDEFFFKTCPQPGQACIVEGTGDIADQSARCASCFDAHVNNSAGLVPSGATCAQFNTGLGVIPKESDPNIPDRYIECYQTSDADVVPGAVSDVQTLLSGGTCAIVLAICDDLIQFPNATRCEGYGDVLTASGPLPDPDAWAITVGWNSLFTDDVGQIGSMQEIESGGVTHQSLCVADPCVVGPCAWDPSKEGSARCVTQDSGVPETN